MRPLQKRCHVLSIQLNILSCGLWEYVFLYMDIHQNRLGFNEKGSNILKGMRNPFWREGNLEIKKKNSLLWGGDPYFFEEIRLRAFG